MKSFLARNRRFFALTASVALLFTPGFLSAEDEKAAFDPEGAEVLPLGLPSPYDKFIALDETLGEEAVDWGQLYNDTAVDVDPAQFTAEVEATLALGIKIADGLMAIKAADAEALNQCARQIEDLAANLGVGQDQLGRAERIREYANRGDWLQVFSELGWLQVDILRVLRQDGQEHRRPLLIAAGWIQGAQYVSSVIETHYSPESSNILREPLLVQALQEELEALPPAIQAHEKVVAIREALPTVYGIVNVPVEASIPVENVTGLREIAETLSLQATRP